MCVFDSSSSQLRNEVLAAPSLRPQVSKSEGHHDAGSIKTLSNDNARLKHEIDVLNAKMASKMADHWMWKDMTKLKNENGLQIERLQAELKESNSLVALNRAGVEKRKREAKEAEENS